MFQITSKIYHPFFGSEGYLIPKCYDNSAITLSFSYHYIKQSGSDRIIEKVRVRAQKARESRRRSAEGTGVCEGGTPSPMGLAWGGGCAVPPPQKMFMIFEVKLLHFWCNF